MDGLEFSALSAVVVTSADESQLMPNFAGITPFMVTYPRDDDIEEAMRIAAKLRLNHIIQHACSMRYITLDAGFYGPRSDYTTSDRDQILTSDELDAMCARLNLGRWNFTGCVYGPPKMREMALEHVKAEMLRLPGSRFFTLEDRTERPSVLHARAPNMEGLCNMDQQRWIKQWMPNGAHLLFTPVSRVDGKTALQQFRLAKKLFAEHQMEFMGHLVVFHRDMHTVSCMVYDSTDAAMRDRAWKLGRRVVQEWQARGWGEMRQHIGLHDQVAASYDFNGHALLRFNETVKAALDPKGIIAPGKSGIWPRQYAKEKWLMGKEFIPAFPGVEPGLLGGGAGANGKVNGKNGDDGKNGDGAK